MKELKRPKRILHHEVSHLKFLLYVDELEAYVDRLEKAIDYIPCCKSDSEQLCDCAMPDPIDPFAEVDKDTCRKCNNLIA